MSPLHPLPPIGPRRTWLVPASNARNSWRLPAIGSSLSWPDPDGPTVAWHVPTSLAARSWRVPAVNAVPSPDDAEGPDPATPPDEPDLAGLPELADLPDGPAPTEHPTARSTWCAPTSGVPRGQEETRAKLVGPVRSRGCAIGEDSLLADALRSWQRQAVGRLGEADLVPTEPAEPTHPAQADLAANLAHRAQADLAGGRDEWPDAATQRRQALHAVARGSEHGDRHRFLAEVRRRLTGSAEPSATRGDDGSGDPPIPQPRYADLDPDDLIGSFVRAVGAAGGRCHYVTDDLPDSLLDLLVAELDAWEIVVSGDEEVRELAERLGNRGVEVAPATPDRAMAAGMGVTSAMAGIAATGALVLDSGRDKGRLAALLPPVHLCVLPVERLVASPSEVLRALGHAPLRLPSSLMLLSGPSRGDDVEKLLTIGALGPAALHVVLLERRFDV